ncbi:universal stress protein [Streptomyces longwoodensis]|uniref:universal stress protein n=1 Tax=Streptomyces longwoodensis TaxID=68231 RepID=UPI00225C34CD|nr:universal stress protein [Streptomyces longwoodensis]MCX4999957.1 universal stress protein [Streptomyces longwoodensis]WUC74958.1 universal stress protein [Streptomyces longwoodensis]
MPRTITVGLDGSPECRAAAEWAAREAELRGLPVKLVHVWEPVPEPMAQAPLLGPETHQHWTERIPRESAEGLRLRHPGIEVNTEQLAGRTAQALVDAAKDAEMLVLGSRGLGGIGGFLVGSVGLAVVAHTERPVVLVRAGEQTAPEHRMHPTGIPSAATALRPVVLGLDAAGPDETLIGFAFEAAARRSVPLRVVHAWNPPPYYAYGMALEPAVEREMAKGDAVILSEVLRPWRQKYPDVDVVEQSRYGSPSLLLIDASREASLVVVGRRIRSSAVGTHIGTVTHAVLHHSTAPVAVVTHG